MLYDLYLKAPDALTLEKRLVDAGVLIPAPTEAAPDALAVADGYCLDLVGTLYAPPVQTGTDKAGMPVYAAPVALDGYHANLRCLSEPDATTLAKLAAVRIAPPNAPKVEWAGGMFPVPLA